MMVCDRCGEKAKCKLHKVILDGADSEVSSICVLCVGSEESGVDLCENCLEEFKLLVGHFARSKVISKGKR